MWRLAGAREGTLTARSAALRERLRAEAGPLPADGLAQQAHRLTFTAEAEPAGDAGAARNAAAQAWEAAGQPYSLAAALLRAAEATLSGGDRDGGATRLRRAAELAQRLGVRPLSDDIALLARRARISLRPADDVATPPARARPAGADGT